MTAGRPNSDETGGDHAGAGELEPGRLGKGRSGSGGRAAAPWPGGRGKAPGVLRLSDVSYCALNIPKLVRQDSGLLWLLSFILSPLSLYLFISPSPVIFVLCLTAPCLPHFSQSLFLFQFLPISVRFSPCLCVPLCFPSLSLLSSLICLSQSRSLVFSLRFHFPGSGLVPCLPVSVSVFLTNFVVSLSLSISLPSLSLSLFFPCLCFSLSLGPFRPLRTESSSLRIQMELGSGSRECPLYLHFLVTLSL